MIRKFTFLALITAAALLAGCSKDEDAQNAGDCRVSHVELIDTAGKYKYTYSLEYDSEGRLSKTNSSSDSAFLSFNAVYNPLKIVLDTKYWDDITYNLDNQGRVTHYIDYEGSETAELKYNEEGYLSEIAITFDFYGNAGSGSSHPDPDITRYKLSYTNGNLTKIAVKKTPYLAEYEMTLEYNNDEALPLTQINEPLDLIEQFYPLRGALGKTSKNQLAKITGGTRYYETSFVTTFSYQKDASGKTSSITRRRKTTSKTVQGTEKSYKEAEIFNLTYQCD